MGGRLDGLRIVVTGASRGLGRALVGAFAGEGATVVATSRRAERLHAVSTAHADAVVPVQLDLGDGESIARAAQHAVAALGRVDVLVNNAGTLGRRVALAEYPLDVWREVLEVGVTGTLDLTQRILPAMAQGGVVVNVTSGAAGRAGWGAYGVAKLALDGITRMLREELAGHGVRCVAVNPGGLRTDMRAAAYPDEDPATLPHPSAVVEPFVAIAEGAETPWRVEAHEW